MRKPVATRVQEALVDMNVALDIQREIMNRAFGMTVSVSQRQAKKLSLTSQSWVTPIESVRAHRRTLMSNRSKWHPAVAHVYAEYLDTVSAVLMKMSTAAENGSLADETRRIALVNVERAKDGRPSLGDRGRPWQSWVPPHVRAKITQDFEVAYIQAGRTKGNRMTPFTTHALRNAVSARVSLLKSIIKSVRESARTPHQMGDYAHTPYRALRLAAARMAERTLAQMEKSYLMCKSNVYDNPPPVNWQHLLTPEMRRRMREGVEDAASVSLEGLGQFYYAIPDPDGSHAATWLREDMHAGVNMEVLDAALEAAERDDLTLSMDPDTDESAEV